MNCEQCHDALSARLDGEGLGAGATGVDAHLAACAACRAFAARAAGLNRALRVRAAEPVPDLTAAILTRIGRLAGAGQPAWWPGARLALVAVAVLQLASALPTLLADAGGVAPVHLARELGSFDVALAIGLLVVARQPARAAGLLPVVACLAACLAGTAVLDVAAGRTPVLGEALHLLDLVGLSLLWALARPARRSHAVLGP